MSGLGGYYTIKAARDVAFQAYREAVRDMGRESVCAQRTLSAMLDLEAAMALYDAP